MRARPLQPFGQRPRIACAERHDALTRPGLGLGLVDARQDGGSVNLDRRGADVAPLKGAHLPYPQAAREGQGACPRGENEGVGPRVTGRPHPLKDGQQGGKLVGAEAAGAGGAVRLERRGLVERVRVRVADLDPVGVGAVEESPRLVHRGGAESQAPHVEEQAGGAGAVNLREEQRGRGPLDPRDAGPVGLHRLRGRTHFLALVHVGGEHRREQRGAARAGPQRLRPLTGAGLRLVARQVAGERPAWAAHPASPRVTAQVHAAPPNAPRTYPLDGRPEAPELPFSHG